MIRVVLLAMIVLGASVAAAYTLNQLDQIVHGQLYNYGLTFSFDWANPYWTLLRVTLILIDVIAVSTVISLALTLQKYRTLKKMCEKKTRIQKTTPRYSRPPSPSPRNSERPETMPPQPTITPRTAHESSITLSPAHSPDQPSGLTRCSHCGKAFTQPLRMLDFQGDRPHVVNICPFCNEIVRSTQTDRNDNQAPESQSVQPTT